MVVWCAQMTVAQLKDECKQKGLSVAGKKADLGTPSEARTFTHHQHAHTPHPHRYRDSHTHTHTHAVARLEEAGDDAMDEEEDDEEDEEE